MEPVGTAASVFTLLEAEELKELDQRYKEIQNSRLSASFYRQLEKTEKTLLDLDKFIAYKLTKTDSHGAQLAVDRSVWLRSEKKIDRFRIRVRECKADLVSTVMSINS
ncbi:MAG: hypothetical protein Q9213_003206 [Squamulea squamosa]